MKYSVDKNIICLIHKNHKFIYNYCQSLKTVENSINPQDLIVGLRW
jgi:hypothetical protein